MCVLHHKTIDRPFYDFPTLTNWAISDGGFYNGWTGGVYVVTKPVKGIYIDDYATGNKYCVAEYGPNAKFSEFHDGKYMSFMNDPPAKVWITWDWSQTLSGGWAHWGYFNH